MGLAGVKGVLTGLGLLVLGLLVGAGAFAWFARFQLADARSEVTRLQAQLDRFTATARAVIPIEPGEGDNAPPSSVWSGQTGRIRYALASTVGFDYIVEMEGMPPNRTWHMFWAIAPVGQNPLENITKAGDLKTDAFGRGTISGIVPLPPGKYVLGHFLSDKDDPNPPFTHRTWLCIRTSASFEVFPKA